MCPKRDKSPYEWELKLNELEANPPSVPKINDYEILDEQLLNAAQREIENEYIDVSPAQRKIGLQNALKNMQSAVAQVRMKLIANYSEQLKNQINGLEEDKLSLDEVKSKAQAKKDIVSTTIKANDVKISKNYQELSAGIKLIKADLPSKQVVSFGQGTGILPPPPPPPPMKPLQKPPIKLKAKKKEEASEEIKAKPESSSEKATDYRTELAQRVVKTRGEFVDPSLNPKEVEEHPLLKEIRERGGKTKSDAPSKENVDTNTLAEGPQEKPSARVYEPLGPIAFADHHLKTISFELNKTRGLETEIARRKKEIEESRQFTLTFGDNPIAQGVELSQQTADVIKKQEAILQAQREKMAQLEKLQELHNQIKQAKASKAATDAQITSGAQAENSAPPPPPPPPPPGAPGLKKHKKVEPIATALTSKTQAPQEPKGPAKPSEALLAQIRQRGEGTIQAEEEQDKILAQENKLKFESLEKEKAQMRAKRLARADEILVAREGVEIAKEGKDQIQALAIEDKQLDIVKEKLDALDMPEIGVLEEALLKAQQELLEPSPSVAPPASPSIVSEVVPSSVVMEDTKAPPDEQTAITLPIGNLEEPSKPQEVVLPLQHEIKDDVAIRKEFGRKLKETAFALGNMNIEELFYQAGKNKTGLSYIKSHFDVLTDKSRGRQISELQSKLKETSYELDALGKLHINAKINDVQAMQNKLNTIINNLDITLKRLEEELKTASDTSRMKTVVKDIRVHVQNLKSTAYPKEIKQQRKT